MIQAVMALSILVSSIPTSRERAPSPLHLVTPPGATLLEPGDRHPAFSYSLLAQADVPARRSYKKFLLIRQGGERIEGSEGVLEASGLTGVSLTGETIAVPLNDIKTLYTSQGSLVGGMALTGGLIGLAFTGACVLYLNHSVPNFFSHDGAVLGSLAGVGGGVLLGAGLGAWIGWMGEGWQVEPLVSPGKLYVLQLSFKL